jgi:glutathione-regulated potassium-efflux system ancillary protein KefG
MAEAAKDLKGVTLVDLYESYPDFAIDVRAEQRRLARHAAVAVQFPVYWYSTPALLKEWFDLVWLHGFAYGNGGTALQGKRMLVACSTGGDEASYRPAGQHRYPITDFLKPLQQTAALCGMQWLEPFVLHASANKSEAALAREAKTYRRRLIPLAGLGASDAAGPLP